MEKRAVFGVVRFWCQYLMYGPRHFSYNARLHHERRRRRSRVHDVSREKVFNRDVAVSSGESSCTACPVFGSNAS